MKYLQEIPEYICTSGEKNYVAYCDTDSVYVNAKPILEFLYPNFDKLDEKEKDDLLEKLALKYQDIITDYYNELARDCFNASTHKLEMKTECVIRSAYFRNTRRYAQWITKQEGVAKEKLDIKGLEFKKSNFPKYIGKFFHDILTKILKGASKNEIDDNLKEFKEKILEGNLELAKLGNPTAVKKLKKYSSNKKQDQIFTFIEKGAPAPVKAAIRYNDLLKYWNLNTQHSFITQYDKVKWVYLHKNPLDLESLAFLDYDLPDKIADFINKYANRDKIWESIIKNKLQGMYSDLGWSFNLNPYKTLFFS